MAAAGGGSGGGGGASTSGCGLKRRYAAAAPTEANQDQPPSEDHCLRLRNGMDLLKDVTENKHFLPTGLEGIDMLLGGGLRQGQLTEITGPSSSGKTQVCLHSASHVAAMNIGSVMYLDTSISFSASRIAGIIDDLPTSLVQEPKNLRLKKVMSSIICETVNSGGTKICLLIIDSISSLLAPIIGGKYPQGRSMMISVAMTLKKLAAEHNLSVLVTNHMVSAGNGAHKPALGESWKAVPHVRLVTSCDRASNICTATVLKHTLLASGRTMKFVLPS
ncbi:hypothetical protein ACP70R_023480 [Stipagrostis hirtigluma subsp. patula]